MQADSVLNVSTSLSSEFRFVKVCVVHKAMQADSVLNVSTSLSSEFRLVKVCVVHKAMQADSVLNVSTSLSSEFRFVKVCVVHKAMQADSVLNVSTSLSSEFRLVKVCVVTSLLWTLQGQSLGGVTEDGSLPLRVPGFSGRTQVCRSRVSGRRFRLTPRRHRGKGRDI